MAEVPFGGAAAVRDHLKETAEHVDSSRVIIARVCAGAANDHAIREQSYAVLRESLVLLGVPVTSVPGRARPDDGRLMEADVEFWLNWASLQLRSSRAD
jgi:hypothetical protein